VPDPSAPNPSVPDTLPGGASGWLAPPISCIPASISRRHRRRNPRRSVNALSSRDGGESNLLIPCSIFDGIAFAK
jgi:hypothetical protein